MNILNHKYQYYRNWFVAMSQEQRETETGRWVFDRVLIFGDLLRQQEREVEQFKRNCVL